MTEEQRHAARRKKIWTWYITFAVTVNVVANVGAYVFHWWR